MAITFELPAEIEEWLRRAVGDLDRAAKEAALVELYRQRKLTHYQLSQSLQLSRLEVDTLLKHHHVTEDLQSVEDFEQELRDLGRGQA